MGDQTQDGVAGAELSDAIKVLRGQLTKAIAEGSGEDLRFGLGPVEVEFEVTLEKAAGAEGGVKFWVVSAEGRGSVTQGARHRVKLELEPLMPDPVTGEMRRVQMGDVVRRRPL